MMTDKVELLNTTTSWSREMPEWFIDGRPLIQVTLWDILGEIPVDMIKPIDPMIASSAIKPQRKKGRKKGKIRNLLDYAAADSGQLC